MKTVIFIIALGVLLTTVRTVQGDAVVCPNSPQTAYCNMCLEGDWGGASTGCFDCKAGYQLDPNNIAFAYCNRCQFGTGTPAGTAVPGTPFSARPSAPNPFSCPKCDPSCSECLGLGPSDCLRCAPGRFATSFSPSGSTCAGVCPAGTTRDMADSTLTAVESEAVCAGRCDSSCAECYGSRFDYGMGMDRCTRCAAGYYLSAKASSANIFGTCSRCMAGYGKDADTATITSTTIATTDYEACKTACTPSSKCLTCSASRPAECLRCDYGFILDPTTKTCKSLTSSGSLIHIIVWASVLAQALF